MLPILKSFVDNVDSNNLRIINFPSLIFMCGGSVPSRNKKRYYSVRHFIYRYLESNHINVFKKIVLAEQINDWYRDGYYKDLLSFEEDIAGLSSVIVLFVESPGSIAELGSFSKMDAINKKLMVVLRQDHYDNESFIKAGPISYLEGISEELVHPYYWEIEKKGGREFIVTESIEGRARDIADSIIKALDAIPKEQIFKADDKGHVLLLICGIIEMMNIVRKREVEIILETFNVLKVGDIVNKYLFILDKTKLIHPYKYGGEKYYISNSDGMKQFIQFPYRANAPYKDILGWKMIIGKQMKIEDSKRLNALKEFRDKESRAK